MPAYPQILLRCSLRQRFVTACPLAFGEVGVKDRIRSILSYKKPAFWIILAALLAGMGLGIFLLTDRPREPEPKAVSFEGLVERVVAGEQLEVQVLGEEYTGTVLVSTKGLEVPILTKGCYIFVSYDPSDLLSDGYVEKVFEVGLLVGGGTVNAETHMEGIVLAAEGDYLQVQVSVGSAAINYYVNRKGHTADPKPGDRVLIRYLPGNDPTRLELVKEIRITGKADWGVTMQVSDVTPTGLTLWIGVASGFPRQLTASDSFTLLNTNGEPIPVLPGETFPGDTYELSGGDTYAVNWETVYGSLAPGQYRLQKAIRHEGEERLVSVDFTVPLPLATELDEAVSQTVRYYISKRLVNPPLHLDKTMEQIPQTEDTGFLDNPTVTLTEGKTYQQIAVSHSIIDRQQFGNEYTLIIAACCRGYNNRQAADSLQCAMRLVIRQNEDGTFTATSCMIPTQLSGQADAELLFGEELARQLREDRMLWDSLENSCDKQVIGGVLTVKGFGQTFAADSMEATLIENAIKAGKKLKKPYEDGYVSTLFVGDTVYYFYFQKGIIHNATEDSYTQLTAEGTQTVNTLFQSAGEQ